MTQAHSPTVAKRRPLSVWELPKLATLVHSYRKTRRPATKIRPHFAAILAFIHRNRLAIANQVRRRFAQYLPSDRTARRHLAEMESLGLLGVQPATNVSPLMPKPYFVTRTGLRHLRQSLAERGKPWESFVNDRRRFGRSFQHVWHELATTEFLLMVWETIQHRPDLELLKVERRSLVKHPAFRITLADRLSYLQPDGLFLFRQRSGGMMCCLLELDTGSQTPRQLAEKFRRYRAWAAATRGQDFLCRLYDDHGAERSTPAFRVLFVTCGDPDAKDSHRLQSLCRLATDQPPEFSQRLWLTSADGLRIDRGSSTALDQPLWIRCVKSSLRDSRQPLDVYPREYLFPRLSTSFTPDLATPPCVRTAMYRPSQ